MFILPVTSTVLEVYGYSKNNSKSKIYAHIVWLSLPFLCLIIDCFFNSANIEQHFIEGNVKLIFKQIVGAGGGGSGGGKCMWKHVWEEHGMHFRLREQQVPNIGVWGRTDWDPWILLECLEE